MAPGAFEIYNLSSVALGRIVRQLVADRRIRIGADAVAADVVHAVRPASGGPGRLVAAIRSGSIGGVRIARGVGGPYVLAMFSALSERRRCNDSGDACSERQGSKQLVHLGLLLVTHPLDGRWSWALIVQRTIF